MPIRKELNRRDFQFKITHGGYYVAEYVRLMGLHCSPQRLFQLAGEYRIPTSAIFRSPRWYRARRARMNAEKRKNNNNGGSPEPPLALQELFRRMILPEEGHQKEREVWRYGCYLPDGAGDVARENGYEFRRIVREPESAEFCRFECLF